MVLKFKFTYKSSLADFLLDLFLFRRLDEAAGRTAHEGDPDPQADKDGRESHDGQRAVDEGHVDIGGDRVGVDGLQHIGDAAVKQQPQSAHGQQNGQDLYAFAGHAREHIHKHVHHDMLFL